MRPSHAFCPALRVDQPWQVLDVRSGGMTDSSDRMFSRTIYSIDCELNKAMSRSRMPAPGAHFKVGWLPRNPAQRSRYPRQSVRDFGELHGTFPERNESTTLPLIRFQTPALAGRETPPEGTLSSGQIRAAKEKNWP